MSVLGAMLIDVAVIAECMELCGAADFRSDAHKAIYQAITGLYVEGVRPDLTAVLHRLEHAGKADVSGGAEYLMNLAEQVAIASNGPHHAKVVRRLAKARALYWTCVEVAGGLKARMYLDDDELAARYAQLTDALQQSFRADRLRDASALMGEMQIDAPATNPALPKVGLIDIDAEGDFFEPGALTVIAGRPGMGKTSFLRQLIRENKTVPSLLCTLEEPSAMFRDKLVCEAASVRYDTFRKRALVGSEQERIVLAQGQVAEYALRFVDGSMGAGDVALYARRLRQMGDAPRVVYVDHLQHMRHARERGENDAQMYGRSVYALAALAAELQCTVVLCAQLNRDPEKRVEPRPYLSDLRDTGAVEQAAFNVLFLWAKSVRDRTRFVYVAKQKNGATFEAEIVFELEKGRFLNKSRMQP